MARIIKPYKIFKCPYNGKDWYLVHQTHMTRVGVIHDKTMAETIVDLLNEKYGKKPVSP